ncbi:MAG: tRNA lysidine(34) synthetase TilS [Betaproteobacteria bacterium]|nr:tRNA lysidine(34) synthetase TilS [Betaproteobacteria bacterium]
MAGSRKSSRSRAGRPDLVSRVSVQLSHVVAPADRLVVGLSGGIDSVALLDCLLRCARRLHIRVAALHVNHQLSAHAGRWSAFCRQLCRARRVPFRSVKVHVARGDSVEAAARDARYEVFRREDADFVALAHHQDDQVETVLLQLLRGAGLRGLAAMPLVRIEDRGSRIGRPQRRGFERELNPQSSILNPRILRPLLDVTRSEILEYARARKLEWVEDESNADVQFARNFLRHKVLPVIGERFPGYRGTIARAARHLADAAAVLDEVAAADGAESLADATLATEALRSLPAARARNLLRYFLSAHRVANPGAERLAEALRQLLAAKQDARVCIELGDASLRRFNGRAYLVRAFRTPRPGFSRRWRGERQLSVPELQGLLRMDRGRGHGISVARLGGRPVTVRVRGGGERLQPDCKRPRRSLKNLLQEVQLPPWERERLALLFCGEHLVWAPGIGVDCAFQAGHDERALRPVWVPVA